jgi:hypothetical protein
MTPEEFKDLRLKTDHETLGNWLRRFWDRMKCWNFMGSRVKKIGVLFPTIT